MPLSGLLKAWPAGHTWPSTPQIMALSIHRYFRKTIAFSCTNWIQSGIGNETFKIKLLGIQPHFEHY